MFDKRVFSIDVNDKDDVDDDDQMKSQKNFYFKSEVLSFSTITVKSIISEMKGNKMILLELKIAF